MKALNLILASVLLPLVSHAADVTQVYKVKLPAGLLVKAHEQILVVHTNNFNMGCFMRIPDSDIARPAAFGAQFIIKGDEKFLNPSIAYDAANYQERPLTTAQIAAYHMILGGLDADLNQTAISPNLNLSPDDFEKKMQQLGATFGSTNPFIRTAFVADLTAQSRKTSQIYQMKCVSKNSQALHDLVLSIQQKIDQNRPDAILERDLNPDAVRPIPDL